MEKNIFPTEEKLFCQWEFFQTSLAKKQNINGK